MTFTRNETGFSLLEVLVAISIFSIGLLAVATMQVTAIQGNRLSHEVTQATRLAEMQIETLKAEDRNSDALAEGSYVDPNNPIDETGTAGGSYQRSWLVTNQTATSKAISVTVTWNAVGKDHRVVLGSLTRGGGY
jgi:type IV pilus assembly protein PilV